MLDLWTYKAPILSPSSTASAGGGRTKVRCLTRATRSAVLSRGNILGFHTDDGTWCRPHEIPSLDVSIPSGTRLRDVPSSKPHHHPSLMVPCIGILVCRQNRSSSSSIKQPVCLGDTLFQLTRGNVGKVGFESANRWRRGYT